MGFVLFIIALLGATLFTALWTPINLIWTLITFKNPYKMLDRWFYYQAELIDVYGNHSLAPLLNRIMIKGNGKFLFTGEERNTISYTIAVNREKETLTKFGKFWAWFLELVDKGHLDKALTNKERRITEWKNPLK